MRRKNIKKEYESGVQSKNRLLEAGCRVFAEQGYYNTKVADICKLAGLNITAVNYHFGSKEGLYKAVWESFAFGNDANAYSYYSDKNRTAKERLANMVCRLIEMNFEKGQVWLFSRMHLMEVLQPTGLLGKYLEKIMKKPITALQDIIREFIPDIDKDDLTSCTFVIYTICRGIYCNTPETLKAEYSIKLTKDYIEHLKGYFTDVCLASIEIYRQRYSSKTV